jgi:uncharacterized protein (DUF2147 family)
MKRNFVVFYATVTAIIFMAAIAHAATPKKDAAYSIPDPNPLRAISGTWYTESREGGVELYPCGNQVCGRFYWLKDDMEKGDVSRDTHNPNQQDRQKPLCKMQFMGGFSPEGGNKYIEGWIYNPRDGGTYSAQMTLVDHDTLDLHGYLFFPALGESQTWKRAKDMPTCQSD